MLTTYLHYYFISLFILLSSYGYGNPLTSRYVIVGTISSAKGDKDLAIIKDLETGKTLTLWKGQFLNKRKSATVKQVARNNVVITDGAKDYRLAYATRSISEPKLLLEKPTVGGYRKNSEELSEDVAIKFPTHNEKDDYYFESQSDEEDNLFDSEEDYKKIEKAIRMMADKRKKDQVDQLLDSFDSWEDDLSDEELEGWENHYDLQEDTINGTHWGEGGSPIYDDEKEQDETLQDLPEHVVKALRLALKKGVTKYN